MDSDRSLKMKESFIYPILYRRHLLVSSTAVIYKYSSYFLILTSFMATQAVFNKRFLVATNV